VAAQQRKGDLEMKIIEKIFKDLTRRDGSKAEFRFTKQEGVWYWDLPHKTKEGKQPMPSLPLPDVELDNHKSLKECLAAIAKERGENWVGQVYSDIMAVK